METLVLTLHIIACLVVIVLVLLQSGKEGMGVIFGGGSSSLFGSSGAGGLLVRLTAFAAAIFLTTSLGSNYLAKPRVEKEQSVIDSASPVPSPDNATAPLFLDNSSAPPDFSVAPSATANNTQ